MSGGSGTGMVTRTREQIGGGVESIRDLWVRMPKWGRWGVYLALIVCALWRLFRRAALTPSRAAVAAAFAALLAHTMMYAAFLEDPMTWTLLAVGTALAVAAPVGARAVVPPEAEPAARGPARAAV